MTSAARPPRTSTESRPSADNICASSPNLDPGGRGRDALERDFLGEKELPDTAYYGVQTLRGKEKFSITGVPMSTEEIGRYVLNHSFMIQGLVATSGCSWPG